MVPITHRNLIANLDTIVRVDHRSHRSVVYNFLPLNHDMGFVGGLLSNFIVPNSFIISSINLFRRRPNEILKTISDRGVTTLPMPDFTLRLIGRLLEAGYGRRLDQNSLRSIETVYCGAEPIQAETIERFVRLTDSFGFDPSSLYFCYGLAEATLIATGRRFDGMPTSFCGLPSGRKSARLGQPLGNTEIKIAGSPSDPDKQGEILLRGPSVIRSYLGQQSIGLDSWLHTGDIGTLNDEDLLVLGRSRDMIIVGSENIFMIDVESALNELSTVKDSLAMAHGNRFSVLVVPHAGSSIDCTAIGEHLASKLGVIPDAIAAGISADIQRTTSGKPMRDATLELLKDCGNFKQQRESERWATP